MATAYNLPTFMMLEYVAEGAANVVYRPTYNGPPDTVDVPTNMPEGPVIQPSSIPGHLLRFKKAVPWIPSYKALYETQITLINPHFPAEFLVSQVLVNIVSILPMQINHELKVFEELSRTSPNDPEARPPKRHGLYLDEDEPHCLFIEDMTADASKGETLIEVKAKWLVQSPNAPKDSKRCRTCALRAMRRAEAKAKGAKTSDDADKDFCPLDLGSADPIAVSRAVQAILKTKFGDEALSESEAMQKLRNALLGFFIGTPILPRLRELQLQLDPEGIMNLHDDVTPSKDFLVATTIRDCTLFIRAGAAGSHSLTEEGGEGMTIEGKLGDLDLKAPEPSKIKYWRGIERDLIDKGWYQALDSGEGTGLCWLQRQDN